MMALQPKTSPRLVSASRISSGLERMPGLANENASREARLASSKKESVL